MRTLQVASLAFAFAAGFIACGDDDDGSINNTNENNPNGSNNNNGGSNNNNGGSNNNNDGSNNNNNGGSNNNNNNDSTAVQRDVVINEVFYAGDGSSDYIELKNIGSETVDLSDYRFCLRVGVYPALSGLEVFGPGDLQLEAGALVTFQAPEDLGDVGSLALYDRGGAFTNPDALIDYVQWGAAQAPESRADIAVQAGEWTEATGGFAFVPSAAANEALVFDGDRGDDPVADYANGVPSPSFEDGTMEVATLVTLSIDNTVPPATVTSSATGSALVTVGDTWLVVLGALEGLSSPLLDIADVGPIHLHFALPGPGQEVTDATGPVAYPLVVDAASDGLSAAFSLRVPPANDLLAPEVAPSDRLQAFKDGRYYINVHTELNGSGELRGQVDFGTTPPPEPEVRKVTINEVLYTGDVDEDFVELRNVGNVPVDLTGWFFCFRVGAYPPLSSLAIIGGSDDLNLDPGEFIVLEAGEDLNDVSGAVALYANNLGFGNPDNIRDYVRYGSADGTNERADVAVDAGLWTETATDTFDFVETASAGQSLQLIGDGLVEPSTSAQFDNAIPTPGT